MQTLWQDLCYGARMLLKKPGFTLIAVLTLALGIGANTAIFSVVDAVLLEPIPYQDPERLVWITESNPQAMGEPIPGPDFLEWHQQNQVFEGMAAYSDESFNLTGVDDPERILTGKVSAGFFSLLGMRPLLGRAFLPEEDKAGGPQVVMLTHGLWQRRFGSDPALLGKTLTLNGRSYTVVGVLPPTFRFSKPFELWMPLALDANIERQGLVVHLLEVTARLKPGIALTKAQADLEIILQRLVRQNPRRFALAGTRVHLTRLQDQLVGDVRRPVLLLLGATGFVLLIACANIANLLLASATARQKEMAVRAALGAGRLRLIRQLLTESALLALIGGTLGMLLALWGVDLLIKLSPDGMTAGIFQLVELKVDRQVLGFTLAVSLFTGLLFGLAPALAASKPNLVESLKEGSTSAAGGLGLRRLHSLLVVAELALALVLLIGAGLMMKSFLHLLDVKPGFNPRNLLTMRLSLPRSKYAEGHQQAAFYQQLLQRVGTLPGVQAAGVVNHLPLTGVALMATITIEGRALADAGRVPATPIGVISPDYFRTMGIPLVHGRSFTERDAPGAARVAIINETFARHFFSDQDPIGKRIKAMVSPDWLSIVGVVGNVRRRGLEGEITPEVYVPYLQSPSALMTLMVRAASDPLSLVAAVRSQVLSIDRDQPVYDVRMMEQRLSDLMVPRRFNLLLFSVFAAIALMLAAVGIYGVMSYSVAQRTHEIGIRLALGAEPRDVRKLVLGQGMILASIGVTIGLALSFALTRLMKSLLFGVSATDPITFASIALLLTGVALLACYIPARRATRVDPMVALRYE